MSKMLVIHAKCEGRIETFIFSPQLTGENKKNRKETSKNYPPANKILIVLSRKANRSISKIKFVGVSSGNLVLWITGGF